MVLFRSRSGFCIQRRWPEHALARCPVMRPAGINRVHHHRLVPHVLAEVAPQLKLWSCIQGGMRKNKAFCHGVSAGLADGTVQTEALIVAVGLPAEFAVHICPVKHLYRGGPFRPRISGFTVMFKDINLLPLAVKAYGLIPGDK